MFLFVFYAVIIWSTFWHYPKYFPKISSFPSNISILQLSVTSAYISTKKFFSAFTCKFALLVKLLLAVQLYLDFRQTCTLQSCVDYERINIYESFIVFSIWSLGLCVVIQSQYNTAFDNG